MPNTPRIMYREMQELDIPLVMQIEHSVYPFPWTPQIFKDCLRIGYICQLGEVDGEVVAYSIVSTGAGDAHILNLCVLKEKQNKGYGRKMMQQILKNVRKYKVDTVLLEVRPSNKAAIHLYEDLGFNRIGERINYYPSASGREDAWIFCIKLFD